MVSTLFLSKKIYFVKMFQFLDNLDLSCLTPYQKILWECSFWCNINWISPVTRHHEIPQPPLHKCPFLLNNRTGTAIFKCASYSENTTNWYFIIFISAYFPAIWFTKTKTKFQKMTQFAVPWAARMHSSLFEILI